MIASNVDRAFKIIEKRKQKAEIDAEQRRLELEVVSPELCDLNRKISRAGLDALRAISMDNRAEEYIRRLAEENQRNQELRKSILLSMGCSADALDVHYTCPICSDTGIVDGHYCSCLKALVKQFQHESLCDCSPANKCTFESFKIDYYDLPVRSHMTEIYNYCKEWAESFDLSINNILMYGKTGLGKTHLSLAIANVVLEKGYDVIYTSAGNLFSQLEKESFGRLRDDSSPMEAVLSCDLLILDDLGSEFVKPFVVSALYNVINSRILSGSPTIVNTNLSYKALQDLYGERIVSRFVGEYNMLEFLGSDVRQLKNDE